MRTGDARSAVETSLDGDAGVSVIASGIDTLYLFSHAPVFRTEFRRLEDAQQLARANPNRLAKGPTLDIAGHYFAMNRHGARTAPYLLDSEHATLLVNPHAASTFPTFTAELRAIYLWQKGARFVAEQAEEIASQLLVRMTPEDARLHVGRVDLAVDFQGWQPREGDGPEFVTRAHDRTSHVQRKVFTGFMFGHGDVAGRLYCKSIEIERSQKKWFRNIWAASKAYDPKRPVWRLEFQLRRPAIVSMELDGEHGPLDTWEDVLESSGALWRYLTRKWLALKHRTKQSRQNFHPAWDALARLGFSTGPWEGTEADLYRIHRQDSAERATGQIAGYLARGLAEHMFHESTDELVQPSLDDALPAIVERVRLHTKRRGRSVEERAQERVASWLATAESMTMNESLRMREPGDDDGDET
ncbi:hypothetical protein A2cp1_3699 [Anaeromyxobacter dehalogenans 2CP-1]|uniref:Replication initiation factor n=1 Tax=Anaeromyxobacter dehalogenans (strain ATCC BAA-258 / DSM 21875 / 2CP-1) TaxID=455488 RepID=B8J6Q3_ANAD2|nr:hypothetical protein A2cp1_3699 [Anaeromyxobacter dehalogenans 2CP-1]